MIFPNPLGFPDGEAVAAGDREGLDENASRRYVLSEFSVRSHRSYQREAWEPYKATYYTLRRTSAYKCAFIIIHSIQSIKFSFVNSHICAATSKTLMFVVSIHGY